MCPLFENAVVGLAIDQLGVAPHQIPQNHKSCSYGLWILGNEKMGIGNGEKEPTNDENNWEEWFLSVQNLNFGKIADPEMVFWMDHLVVNQR